MARLTVLALVLASFIAASSTRDARFNVRSLRPVALLQREASFRRHSTSAATRAAGSCSVEACSGDAPVVDGQSMKDAICASDGMLIIAMPEMACTKALEGALQAKGAVYTLKAFDGDFQFSEDNPVWSWLHDCTSGVAPGDAEKGTTMHSYAFLDGQFLGQGFEAARLIQSGAVDDKLDLTAAPPQSGSDKGASCDEQYADEAKQVQEYMEKSSSKVLLFGWLDCPCTGIAQGRFAEISLCYDSNTWADPGSDLMKYLQCKENDSMSHSFVYFREGGSWIFKGNGFQFDDDKMSDDEFEGLVQAAGAETTCEQSSVKRNVFGLPLEECRVGSDESGSWMSDGKCTEQSAGVHQICIEHLPADFSSATHQGPWSEERKDKRHCVCIGAWSLYMTDASQHQEGADSIMPHCKSIPETSLTKRYLENWKDWRGYAANIIIGVNELVGRCLHAASQEEHHATELQCGLKERFVNLQDDVPELQAASELDDLREEFKKLSCDV